MKEAFMEFANDYHELILCSKEFYKKHWKGVIVLNVAIYGAFLVGWYGAERLESHFYWKKRDKESEI